MGIKVQQYIRNVAKSTVYSAAEVLSDNFNNIKDFTRTNAEITKAAYDSVKDYRNVFKRVKTSIQGSDVYVAAQVGIKSLVQDITTGDFYNVEREQEILNKYGGSLLDDSMFDMDSEGFSFEDPDLDMSDGEKIIATAVKKNSKISTAIISESVAKTGKAQIDTSRENTALLYSQNERLISKLNSGFESITSFLTSNAEQNARVQNKQNENMNKFFTNMEKNTNKIVAQLDELVQLQREVYKPETAQEKKKKPTLLDVADGGIVDIKEYINVVKKNIDNQINELSQGAFAMGDAVGGGNLLATLASNPVRMMVTGGLRNMINKDFKKAAGAFDETFANIFPNFITKANTAKDSDSFFARVLGNIFGLKIDKADSNFDTSRYTKGPVPFDGVTRQSIIEVIPSHLRKIESLLSGGEERLYDFKNGKWTTVKEVHKRHTDWRKDHNRSMKNYLSQVLRTGLGKDISRLFENYDSQEKFEKSLDAIATILSNTGDLASLNEYGLDEDLVNAIKTVLSDDRGIKREMIGLGAKGRGRYKTTIDPDEYKNNNRRMASSIATIYAENNRSRKRTQEDIETNPLSVERILYSEGIAADEKYNGYRNKYGDLNKEVLSSPFALSMLHQKDSYGNTIYEYLRYIKMDLTSIRDNTSRGIFGSRRRPSDNSTYNKNLMDFERDGYVLSDDNAINKYERRHYNEIYKRKESYESRIQNEINEYEKSLQEGYTGGKKKKPVYAKNMSDLTGMIYENIVDQEVKERKKKIENKDRKKTVWDVLYSTGAMNKDSRDKYNDIMYDSNRGLQEQLSEIDNNIGKIALLTDYANNLSQKPWKAATQALYKMDYWITSLFFGEDLKKHNPDKEDEERQGLFGIIKKKFSEGFENIVNTITNKFNKLMEEKIRPWMDKFLKPVKDFIFGKREDSRSDFDGGLLSPFLNNMRAALKKNSEDVKEYLKKQKEEAERKAREAGLLAQKEEEEAEFERLLRSSSSSTNAKNITTAKYEGFENTNPDYKRVNEFLIANNVVNRDIVRKHPRAGKVNRKLFTELYTLWLLNKDDPSYLGGRALWDITISEYLDEKYPKKAKEGNRKSNYIKKLNKRNVDKYAIEAVEKRIENGYTVKVKDADKRMTETIFIHDLTIAHADFFNGREDKLKYIEWLRETDYTLAEALGAGVILEWKRDIASKSRKANNANRRRKQNNNINNKEFFIKELSNKLNTTENDPIIETYLKYASENKYTYKNALEDDNLFQNFLRDRQRLLTDPKWLKHSTYSQNMIDKQQQSPTDVVDNGDDIYDIIVNNNSILTDKIAKPLDDAVSLLKRIADKITSIPDAGPLNAKGGINKTGKPLPSVVSSGEIINGSVVPPGGPYLTTIPKGGVVINPADNTTINKQATQEKSFLNKIRTNANADDGLSGGILNDKRTADVLVRGGMGGLIGLLLGHPLIGLGIGGSSALHKDSGSIANALFGDFIEINEDGKVIRKDNGLISQEIQNAVPDAKLGALIGGAAGLFTPFGPVGGLLVGSALGFAKNSDLLQGTLFGEEGLITPDKVNQIKKALPRMGLGALAGSFLGPFGIVGNAILGASAGYVTSLESFQDTIFGKKENGVRVGGLMHSIKKGAEPLKDFGRTIINGITDEIFGKKDDNGKRVGGIFGMVRDHIVEPLGEGIKPLLHEGKLAIRKGFEEIPKVLSNYLRDNVGEQLYARIIGGLGAVGKGALKVGKVGIGAALSPFMLGAHAVKGLGSYVRRKQIRTGTAYDMTAFERNKYRENSKWMVGPDDWSNTDNTLEMFSANNSYEDLEELQRLIRYQRDGDKAIDDERYKIRKDYSQTLESNIKYKGTAKLMKLINNGKFKQAEDILRNDNTLKNKDGSPLTPEQREHLLKRLDEVKYESNHLNTKYQAIKESGRQASDVLKEYGIDLDLNNNKDVEKFLEYADREVVHMKAGLSEEEKRRKLEMDPNNPLNRNTTGLQELNTTMKDLIEALVGEKSKIRKKYLLSSGSDEDLEKLAKIQYNEEMGFGSDGTAEPSSDWVNERVEQLKNSDKAINPKEMLNQNRQALIDSIQKSRAAIDEASEKRKEDIVNNLRQIASDRWNAYLACNVDFNNPPDTADGKYVLIIDGEKYEFTDDPMDIGANESIYIRKFCEKKLGPEYKNALDNASKGEGKGFVSNIFNKVAKSLNRRSVLKTAAGITIAAGLGGVSGIAGILAANAGPAATIAGVGLAGWGANKLRKKFKTQEASEPKLKKMAEKEFNRRNKNGEFTEDFNVFKNEYLERNPESTDEEIFQEFKKTWVNDRMNNTRGNRFQGLFGGLKNKKLNASENVKRMNEDTEKEYTEFVNNQYKTDPEFRLEYDRMSDAQKEKHKKNWMKKRNGGILSGVKNWIKGSKDHVDESKNKASVSDRIVNAITETLPNKMKEVYESVADDDKKVPTWIKALFGITKWVVGVPLLVGFMNETVIPFMKNKVRPILLGEYNSTTEEYEGGLASGIVNPLRKFFKDKFGKVHDWFHNTGDFTNENSGFKGLINNFKGLGMYFMDIWKSGLTTILTTILPTMTEEIIANFPDILKAFGDGVIDGFERLLDKKKGDQSTTPLEDYASSMTRSTRTIDLAPTNKYGFNNTVGGAIAIASPTRGGMVDLMSAFNVGGNYNSGVRSDITTVTNPDGTVTNTNSEGKSVTSKNISDQDVYEAGVNKAGNRIYYRTADTKQQQPLIKSGNQYIPAADLANTMNKNLAGNEAFNRIVEMSNSEDYSEYENYDNTHLTTFPERLLKHGLLGVLKGTDSAHAKSFRVGGKAVNAVLKAPSAIIKRLPVIPKPFKNAIANIIDKPLKGARNAVDYVTSYGADDKALLSSLNFHNRSVTKNAKNAAIDAFKQSADETREAFIREHYDDFIKNTDDAVDYDVFKKNFVKNMTKEQIDELDDRMVKATSEAANKAAKNSFDNSVSKYSTNSRIKKVFDNIGNSKFGNFVKNSKVGQLASKTTDILGNLNKKVMDSGLMRRYTALKDKLNPSNLINKGKGVLVDIKDKAIDTVKKTKVGTIVSNTKSKADDLFKKLKGSIDDILKKIFKSKPFKKLLKEGGEELSEEMLEKIAKESCEKIAKEAVEQGTKQLAKSGAKTATKQGILIACDATGIGVVVNIAMIIADFCTGMANARNILQINEEEIDWADRLIAGIAKALTSVPFLGLIGEQAMVWIILNTVGKLLFKNKTEEIKKEQEEAKAAVEEYNAIHNTNLSLEQFNNKFEGTSNWYTRLGQNTGNFFMDKLGGGNSNLKEDLSESRYVNAEGEFADKIEKIRKHGESIVGRIWNYYSDDIKKYADKSKFTQLSSQVLDKIVSLLNKLNKEQLKKVKDHVTDIDGGIADFRINGKKAWDAGWDNAITYLELPDDAVENHLVRTVAALASVFVKSFGGAGLKPKVKGIVVTVFGKAFATAKDKELQALISEENNNIIDVNNEYDEAYGSSISARNAYLANSSGTTSSSSTGGSHGGGGRHRGVATNARANDKLTPISSFDNGTNFTDSIGSLLNQSIEKSLTGFDEIGKVIAKLVSKNKAINKKIDSVEISPEDEKYWQIDVDAKTNAFASAIFKFNEVMSRVIKAPFSLVTKTMGSSNNILASTANSNNNGTTSTSKSSSNSNTTQKSGVSKLLDGVKNTAKKLFGWITGKGKEEGEYGRAVDDMNDPFHIYQRAYTGSYQTKGDTERQTVADSACGPAAAASVLRMYGKKGTMKNAVNYALNNNYKEVNGGTYPEYFDDYLNKNGIDANTTNSNKEVVQNLVAGKPVILMGRDASNSGRTPYGSKYSHYVVARDIDGDGNVIVEDSEDPNGSTRYSLEDTLANSNIKITTSGRGKYGRANENTSITERFINTTAGVISGTTANIITSVLGNAGITTGTNTTTKANSSKSGSSSMADTSDPGSTDGRKKAIWSFFKSNGFSDNLAAAVMGNMQRESGFNPSISERASGVNSAKVEDLPHSTSSVNGTGMGFGLIQWSYAHGHAALYNWCKANGCDPNTLDGQLKWVVAQLKGINIADAANSDNVRIFGVTGDGTMSYNYSLIQQCGGFEAMNKMDIPNAVATFYDCIERGANRASDLVKSISYANTILREFATGTGRGRLDKIRENISNRRKPMFGRGGIFGRMSEEPTSNSMSSSNSTSSSNSGITVPNNNSKLNTSLSSSRSSVSGGLDGASFLTKFGSYVGKTFKTIYGPYWDALYGDEVEQNTGSVQSGNTSDVIYAAAMVFEALGRANPSFIYDASCTTYFDLECADGTILKHIRPDCSGMMSAVLHYMGYYTQRPYIGKTVKCGDGYHGEGFGSQDFENATSINCIYDQDGNISNDWVLLEFNANDRQPGDILVKYNHMDMYLFTVDSMGSWKWRGFSAGSPNGMRASYELAKYYLENNNWEGQSGTGTIQDDTALKILRYVGTGTGRGRAKKELKYMDKPRRGEMHKYEPDPIAIKYANTGDRSARGNNNHTLPTLKSHTSNRTTSSNTSQRKSTNTPFHSDSVRYADTHDTYLTQDNTQSVNNIQQNDLNSLLTILEVIADNSARTERIIELLTAIATNTAINTQQSDNDKGSNKIRQLISQMRSNNNGVPVSALGNIINSDSSDIASAVYSIAKS